MRFNEMLARGLGRAVLHLQTYNARPHRHAILHACTHFLGYDAQTESDRDLYYFDILNATGEPDWYVSRLTECFDTGNDLEMPRQVFKILARFAAPDDTEIRTLLYDTLVDCIAAQEYVLGEAEALIALDGLSAYVFVVRQWRLHPPSEDDYFYEPSLLDHVEERFGEEAVSAALATAALEDYLPDARAARGRWNEKQRTRVKRPAPDYDTVHELITKLGRQRRYPMWSAGREADNDLLLRLAEDLLAETNPDRLWNYLNLFGRRPFPLDPARLLALARHEDIDIANAARRALVHVTHPAVRELALSLIAEGHIGHCVQMLAANPVPEDDYPLFATLTEAAQTKDDFHSLGIEIRGYFDEHPSPAAAPALLNLYEHGYCTMCRYGVVKGLLQLNALPPAIAAEYRFDADEDTRKLILTAAALEQY